ncbi:hypothetical protein AHAS_Ahas11G0306400 [Arachis hypogaea]
MVSSPERSNQNHQSVAMAAASNSTRIVASSFVPLAIAMAYTPVMIPISGEVGEPDVVEDVLRDDDDVEPAMIDEDSDDDIGRNIPVRASGVLSSGTQQ